MQDGESQPAGTEPAPPASSAAEATPAVPTMAAAAATASTPAPAASRSRAPWFWLAACLLLGLAVGVSLRWMRSAIDGAGPDHLPRAPVTILTTPADAMVMVDGAIVGRSPVRQVELTVGLHSLRIEKEGFSALVAPLTVAAEGPPQAFSLSPVEFARLEVASTPAGAQVFVDGDFRGVSPLTVAGLKPGIHDLLVEKANYTAHQSRYTLRAGETRPVNDIVLDNKLLLMLKANLEINPRAIGNNLDLAHFYYVNNEMPMAVKYYMRARELASLPMPPPLPDTPQEDITFQQQLFQDEIRRIKTEEDHHYQNFREYYGTGLDFETFRREYAKGVETFNRWAGGIQDLNWVMEQGQAALTAGNPERAAELFSDFALRENNSGVALGCEAAALIAAGKIAEAKVQSTLAVAALGKDNPDAKEKRWTPVAWRLMGSAWRQYGMRAVGPAQQPALANAATCLTHAVELSTDKLDLAEAQFADAKLARDLRETAKYATQLRAAFATISAHAVTMKGNPDTYALCTALLWPVQYEMAFTELAGGDKAKATALLRQIVQEAPETTTVRSQANHALELLDSGKSPVMEPQ